MTVHLKLYNKDDTYLEYYKDEGGLHRWRLISTTNERDVIGASHQGWKDKEQCIYNARYIITSEWDVEL